MIISKRASPYLKQTESQIEIAAKEAGITPEMGGQILDHFFRSVRSFINDDRMPAIMLPVWGKLTPTIGSIRRAIRLGFKMYRLGRIPKRILEYRVKRLWPIRLRLIYTKLKKETFKDWYKIPSNWVNLVLKKEVSAVDRFYYKGGRERWEKKQGIKREYGREYGSKFDSFRVRE